MKQALVVHNKERLDQLHPWLAFRPYGSPSWRSAVTMKIYHDILMNLEVLEGELCVDPLDDVVTAIASIFVGAAFQAERLRLDLARCL